MERYQLTHRDFVSDRAMCEYRTIMGPHWFPNDLKAQVEYENLPGNPAFGNVTHNMCILEGERVIGTISLYDFANIRLKTSLTNSNYLENLPGWLTSYAYQGDISTIPELQKQGLSGQMINETLRMAQGIQKHRIVFGITKNTNTPMKGSLTNSGGEFVGQSACLFIKLSDTHRPKAEMKLKSEIVKMHLDEKFPPVIQMFHNKKGDLVAATIATSPNVPNTSDANSTGDINELYPNQCIGIINPELSKTQVNELARDIYSSVGRFKYVSLYQMSEQRNDYRGRSPINNGFKQGWIVYKFNLN